MKKIEVSSWKLNVGLRHIQPGLPKKLFDGKVVSHRFDFDYDADSIDFAESINQISVSGVQEKISAVIEKDKIILTPTGRKGCYSIKPAPNYKHLRLRNFIPTNEHLMMQIARQVYKINVPETDWFFLPMEMRI